MATNTKHLNLRQPSRTDLVVVETDLNENYQKIDDAVYKLDVRVIDTIDELKKLDLKLNNVVEVLGYYSKDDGATHKRVISQTDDGSGVQLLNGLWANIIIEKDINVKCFGAKGDNVFDNTEILQKCLNYQNEKLTSITNTTTNGNTYTYTTPYLYFPKGIYRYSQLWLKKAIYIKGEQSMLISSFTGNYTLAPLNNVWNEYCGWRGHITGMQFSSDKLFQFNSRLEKSSESNLDEGQLIIEKCGFFGCNTVGEIDLQSSIVTFKDNIFSGCGRTIIRACDQLHITNNWIAPKENVLGDYEGIFELGDNSKHTFFEGNILTPRPQAGKEVAWINKSGNGLCSIISNRFGGEAGSFTVANYKTEKPTNFEGMIIDKNILSTVAEKSNSCVVRLFTLPKNLQITNNSGGQDLAFVIKVSSTISDIMSLLPIDKRKISDYRIKIKNNYFNMAYNKRFIDDELDFLVFSKYGKVLDMKSEKQFNYFRTETDPNGIIAIPIYYLNGEPYYDNRFGWTTGIYDVDITVNPQNYYTQNISGKIQIYTDYNFSQKKYSYKATFTGNIFPNLKTGGIKINKVLIDVTRNFEYSSGTWTEDLLLPSGSDLEKGQLARIGFEITTSDGTPVDVSKIIGFRIEKKSVTKFYKATPTPNFFILETPYMKEKMQQEGVYDDFISYMDSKIVYDKQQEKLEQDKQVAYEEYLQRHPDASYEDFLREIDYLDSYKISFVRYEEPEPSEKLKAFMEKWL